MKYDKDRLIGRKEIMYAIESLYGITSWHGARYHIKKHSIPVHRTDSGKPMIYIQELIEFELKKGRRVSLNDLTIL